MEESEGMVKCVNIYVIRHGQKQNTAPDYDSHKAVLTSEGIEQIRRSARNNLVAPFDAVYSSPKVRACETACLAYLAVTEKIAGVHVQAHGGLDYEGAPWSGRFKQCTQKVAWLAAGSIQTAGHWQRVAPDIASFLRKRVSDAIIDIAETTVRRALDRGSEQDIFNILAASHSPTAEFAAPNLAAMPLLGEADIAHYVVKLTFLSDMSCVPEITECNYIARGF